MYASTVHNCTNGNESWSEAAPLVTKLLADEGYDCGLAGKFHLSAAHNRIEPRVDDGYRVFDWSHHPQDSWPRGHAYKDWLSEQGVDYKSTHEKRGSIPPEFHQTKWCADRAIEFLREKREKPWLFSYNCFDPHPPFDPPQEYLRHYPVESVPGPLFRDSDLEQQSRMQGRVAFQSEVRRPEEFQAKATIAKYWAMIEQIDDHVGRILEALDESGQRENTVVIFTSDHGEMLGDHGLLLKGCRFYDGLVRVPLIVSWPGHFPRGVRSSALVELTDLAPTLMEIAASTAPGRMQGQSLKPLLEGRTRSHRDFVRSEYYRTLQGIPSHATMVRSERFKQVVYHDTGLGELFDMEEDSGEFENLWDDPRLADVRHEHVVMNFDALAAAVDVGSRRVGRY
jgi:arylsulfatase A-like enzyme